jgi:predicted secreted Zn-dependent protease
MFWIGVEEHESPHHDSFVEVCVPIAMQLGLIGPDDEVRCAEVRGENEFRNVRDVFRMRGKTV